jgi:hypothetical protein
MKFRKENFFTKKFSSVLLSLVKISANTILIKGVNECRHMPCTFIVTFSFNFGTENLQVIFLPKSFLALF